MRLPIKINKRNFPTWITKIFSTKDDPRLLLSEGFVLSDFESIVASIKIGDTWKSTRKNRHMLSDLMIVKALKIINNPNILEIGVSTGSTSLELLDQLCNKIGKYWATDLFFHFYAIQTGDVSYFYHPLNKRCIMRVSDLFLVYEEIKDSFPPFGWLASNFLTQAPLFNEEIAQKISFVHPTLLKRSDKDKRVIVCEHDVFQEWTHEKVHLIKVANVLNRYYFKDSMISSEIEKIKNALLPEGYLLIIDNRALEQASLFVLKPDGKFVVSKDVNGGCEIKDLVCT